MFFLKTTLGKYGLKFILFLPALSIVWLLIGLDRFTGVDSQLRLLISGAILLFYLFLVFIGLYFLMNKRVVGQWVVALSAVALLFGTTYSAAVANRVMDALDTITERPIERGYSLVSMAEFDAQTLFGYGRVGVLAVVDEPTEEGRMDFLETQDYVPNPVTTTFDAPVEMINALYAGEIDAMIINSNFVNVFDGLDGFEDIGTDTKVLATFDVIIQQEERPEVDPGEPFSILLLGLNQNDEALTSGQINTFMLLTVNLQESSFTAVSIPRDSFVPLPCSNYRMDKLSHSNAGGTACAVSAIEHLFDMEIDYYVKLNFTGFMEIIDVLGGIEVDVPFAFSEQNSQRRFGSQTIYVEAGLQRLNAEEALAFVRHRNLRGTSTMVGDDFARVGNQQLVFQAMLREMFTEVDGIGDILPLLEVIGVHVETNFTTHDITTIGMYMIEMFQGQSTRDLTQNMHFINFVILGEGTDVVYPHVMNVVQLYLNMVEDARRLMMVNLGLEEPTFAFTFAFDAFDVRRQTWSIPQPGIFLGQETPAEQIPVYTPPPWQPPPPPVYVPSEPESPPPPVYVPEPPPYVPSEPDPGPEEETLPPPETPEVPPEEPNDPSVDAPTEVQPEPPVAPLPDLPVGDTPQPEVPDADEEGQ